MTGSGKPFRATIKMGDESDVRVYTLPGGTSFTEVNRLWSIAWLLSNSVSEYWVTVSYFFSLRRPSSVSARRRSVRNGAVKLKRVSSIRSSLLIMVVSRVIDDACAATRCTSSLLTAPGSSYGRFTLPVECGVWEVIADSAVGVASPPRSAPTASKNAVASSLLAVHCAGGVARTGVRD